MSYQFQPTSYVSIPLDAGQRGNLQTVQAMTDFVYRDVRNPWVVALARSIVSNVAPHDEYGEATAIFSWVQRNLRYVKHPLDAQWVQDTERTVSQYGQGDCTSLSVALATLLGGVGILTQWAVCGYDAHSDEFDHVWVQAIINGQPVNLDPSNDQAQPGWMTDCATMAISPMWGLGQGVGYLGDDGQFTDTSGDVSGDGAVDTSSSSTDNFDFSSFFTDPNTGGVAGSPWDFSNIFTDPNSVGTDNSGDWTDEQALAYLQDNFPIAPVTDTTGSNLQDWGVYVNNDGSYVQVNSDGTLSFFDKNGAVVGQVVDANGNPINASNLSQTVQNQIGRSAAKSLDSGGSGFSLGSGGPQHAPSGAPAPSTASTLSNAASTIAKTASSVLSAFGLGPNRYPTGTVVNPVTGLPISRNGTSLSLSPQGAGLNISTNTLLIIGLLFFAFKGK